MLLLSQGFGENINPLEIRRNVRKRYHPTFQGVLNRMTINLNVLGAFMENEIGGNLNSTSVISMKRGTSSLRKPKLLKKTAKSKQGKWHNIYPFCFTSFPKKKRDNTDCWINGTWKDHDRRIENNANKQVIFSKWFIELMKVFNCMEQIIRRYQRVTGTHISKQDNREQRHNELARMRNETHNLQLNLQRNTNDDLSFIQFKDFDELEQQLEHSIKKVKMLEAENEQICHWELDQAVIERFPFSGEEQPNSVLHRPHSPSFLPLPLPTNPPQPLGLHPPRLDLAP
ncbi:hypothetical protein AAG906_031537 [Vitis piasezkii]